MEKQIIHAYLFFLVISIALTTMISRSAAVARFLARFLPTDIPLLDIRMGVIISGAIGLWTTVVIFYVLFIIHLGYCN